MMPQITKQKKILLQDNNQKNPDFSRLKAEIDIPTAVSTNHFNEETLLLYVNKSFYL